ncbi:hypothetical protein ABZY45_11740 [Streptomyces sp. NPDC006516]|uniref:hypothetical protein n=1 Tax=Streptomyces sp. NPDC006516 TaxID=3154309 RepID=UPI0033BDFD8B
MSNDIRTPVSLAPRALSGSRWWAVPLTGTLAAPALTVIVSSAENAFAGRTFLLTGGMVLAYALILPSWFLGRTPDRRHRRTGLVVSGCAIAFSFPALISTLGWTVFLVALLTGQVDG